MKKLNVTQSDIADRAGVSRASVSAVLNGTRGVSAQLRRKVDAAIAELQYEPNAVARGLKLRRTLTIGMLISNIVSPFWPAVVRSVEDTARAHNYAVLFQSTDEDPLEEARGLRLLRSRRVDGLIVAPTGEANGEKLLQIQESGTPIVLVDRCLDAALTSVTVDNEAAAYEAVRHLVDAGRRRIAFLAIPTTTSPGAQRLHGYVRACRDGGVEVGASLVRTVSLTDPDNVGRALDLLMARPLPDAIFTGNALATIAALGALRSRRIRVPDDIALIAFDDLPWLAIIDPPVTAIAQPMHDIGREATQQVIRAIEGKGPTELRIVLRTSFIHRLSCGCPIAG